MNSRTVSNEKEKFILPTDRIAILGASRGLGWALYQELRTQNKTTHFFLSSRKILHRKDQVETETILQPQDFSKAPVDELFLKSLEQFAPTRLVYVAGGGPYGEFQKKNWSDHMWALTTSFLYPAELLHTILSNSKKWPHLKQIVFVGSEIAEFRPDQNASSYAAAKHALKGLITTIQLESSVEGERPSVLLFSPGYMQTDMLPENSAPRTEGLAADPKAVAKKLIAAIEKNNQR